MILSLLLLFCPPAEVVPVREAAVVNGKPVETVSYRVVWKKRD